MTDSRPYQVYVCNDDPDGRIFHIAVVRKGRANRIIARFDERRYAVVTAHRMNASYQAMVHFGFIRAEDGV